MQRSYSILYIYFIFFGGGNAPQMLAHFNIFCEIHPKYHHLIKHDES